MKISIPNLSLVVLIGPSGSGKSTFAGKHFLPTEALSSDGSQRQSVTRKIIRRLWEHCPAIRARSRTKPSGMRPRNTGSILEKNPDLLWVIERLTRGHDRSLFNCGHLVLDDWLKTRAGQFDRKDLARTFVAVLSGQERVLGYYALASHRVRFEALPE